MKDKRPLVWLSAAHTHLTIQDTLCQDWQMIPIDIETAPPGDRSGQSARVGVLDLRDLSSSQLALLSSWLEALIVEHWVAVLEPGQIENADICGLVNQYCRDYHKLPIQPERLQVILGHLWGMSELQMRASRCGPLNYHDIVLDGESLAIRRTRGLLRRFACTEEPVLISGENGTGKEAAAKFIHNTSNRRNNPLIVINCAALPSSLTQSELFGHEKGSFTHALETRKGKIEGADGGTLLLLGVDELVSEQQSAILRFLQEGHIERIGGCRPIKVDARLIATSTSPLEQLVAAGRFRSDVFYRLGSLHVRMPPLRDRREDISLLANRILSATPLSAPARRLADSTAICLAKQPWPGNLRELQNRICQALLLGDGPVLEPGDMGFNQTPTSIHSQTQELSLDAFRSKAERQAISLSLTLAQNNVSAAARLLNISRVSFYRLMDKYQILHKTSVSSSKSV